jgi:hypothetical protein
MPAPKRCVKEVKSGRKSLPSEQRASGAPGGHATSASLGARPFLGDFEDRKGSTGPRRGGFGIGKARMFKWS